MDAECQHVNCVSCVPVDRDCSVPAAGYSGSFGTRLPDPPCPIVDHTTYWERLEALDKDSYEYCGEIDSQP